jgi:hypothetical protein
MTRTRTKENRRFGLSPALVLSVVALFAALTGAAAALPGENTVNSGDIVDETVKARDIKAGGIKAAELGDGMSSRTNSTVVEGGLNENSAYTVDTVSASCAPGEELISGSAHWTNNADNEELFVQEISLDHDAESVTARGGNDTAADRTFAVVAHCLGA